MLWHHSLWHLNTTGSNLVFGGKDAAVDTLLLRRRGRSHAKPTFVQLILLPAFAPINCIRIRIQTMEAHTQWHCNMSFHELGRGLTKLHQCCLRPGLILIKLHFRGPSNKSYNTSEHIYWCCIFTISNGVGLRRTAVSKLRARNTLPRGPPSLRYIQLTTYTNFHQWVPTSVWVPECTWMFKNSIPPINCINFWMSLFFLLRHTSSTPRALLQVTSPCLSRRSREPTFLIPDL